MSLLTLLRRTRTYRAKVLGIASANLVSYLPLWEASGSVAVDQSGHAYNGAYTGVDLGQTGIGDGRTAPYWDGVNDTCNTYSAGLAGAFSGSEGTISLWARAFDAATLSAATLRYLINFENAAGTSLAAITKPTTSNVIQFFYRAGGVSKTINQAQTGLLWNHYAVTWSATADQMKGYYNGAQVGVTQTGLGVWSGALSSTRTTIGALASTPSAVWNGNLAHAVLYNAALSAAQVAQLAVI